MYTPNAMESASAAVTNALAIRWNENVNLWRDSIRCQRSGMKFALGSGVGHASRYARNRASSLSSTLPRIEFILPLLHRLWPVPSFKIGRESHRVEL